MIFLIKKAWGDFMENNPHAAFGYKIIGYTTDEQAAKDFCSKQGTVTKKEFGWAADESAPICKYETLKPLEIT